MKKPIIVSNTKNFINDYKTLTKIHEEIYKYLDKDTYKYYLAIPHVFIAKMKDEKWQSITIGAQNLDLNNFGNSETGINNAAQIRDAGASFVILGHSETRNKGENNETINQKVIAGLEQGLEIILCVGEKDRKQIDNQNEMPFVNEVKEQILSALTNIDKSFLKNITIAYEPVWAIGSSVSASTKQILEMNIIIRRILVEKYGIDNAKTVNIIYGGSVNIDNAKGFMTESGCDGLLIGRSSVDAKEFAKIINIINQK